MKRLLGRSRFGFTLIELLVVIGVLAVVAAGVVALINPRDKILQANDSKVKNDVGQLATAVQSYAAQNAVYPTTQGNYVPSELQQMPVPPSGYGATYTVTYDTAAPTGETLVVAGAVRSSRSVAEAVAAGVACTATNCFWKWSSGTTGAPGGVCYTTSATALTCP